MRRILNAEWAGLLAAIVVGAIILAVVSPNFLSEFNFYVLLRSVCVSIVVAFAQMVTLAVGQMNLSVGALGGMVAVLFGGMMEVLGVPLWLAVPLAIVIGVAGDSSTASWRRAPASTASLSRWRPPPPSPA